MKLVYAALPHVAERGWDETALKMAAVDLDETESLSWRLFPDGVNQMIEMWSQDTDKKMLARLKRRKTAEMRVRDKVALAVKVRLELLAPYKQASEETAKYLALPPHVTLGAKLVCKTVDEIWYWAGDRSTDYNWYTKRGLLSGVYGSTFVYWLKDTSKDHNKTWEFLDQRIDNIMKLGSLPQKMMDCGKDIPHRISEVFRALRP